MDRCRASSISVSWVPSASGPPPASSGRSCLPSLLSIQDWWSSRAQRTLRFKFVPYPAEAYTQEMIYRAAILALALYNVLPAQEAPRSKISGYPASAKLPAVEIGAEYLVNSIPLAKGVYIARSHLVLEVAIFPNAPDGVNVSSSQFTLQINYKAILHADSSAAVAAS